MKETSIRFFTDLPYADIHNEGGEIVVTKRMKGYFWHKYIDLCKAQGRHAAQGQEDTAYQWRGRVLEVHGIEEGRHDNQDT